MELRDNEHQKPLVETILASLEFNLKIRESMHQKKIEDGRLCKDRSLFNKCIV